jgi:hypothetical protein
VGERLAELLRDRAARPDLSEELAGRTQAVRAE